MLLSVHFCQYFYNQHTNAKNFAKLS